jgi:hypothetical protein
MTDTTKPKKEFRPRPGSKHVTHHGARIMLAVYDMAEAAGLTRQELTHILAETLERRISQDTW